METPELFLKVDCKNVANEIIQKQWNQWGWINRSRLGCKILWILTITNENPITSGY